MKKITFVAILLFVCTFSAAAQTTGNATSGPVWRVVYYRVLPGKVNENLMDMRKNIRPIYEEGKKQGIILDYKLYQKKYDAIQPGRLALRHRDCLQKLGSD